MHLVFNKRAAYKSICRTPLALIRNVCDVREDYGESDGKSTGHWYHGKVPPENNKKYETRLIKRKQDISRSCFKTRVPQTFDVQWISINFPVVCNYWTKHFKAEGCHFCANHITTGWTNKEFVYKNQYNKKKIILKIKCNKNIIINIIYFY